MEELNDKLLPWVQAHADDTFFVIVWAMGTHHPFTTPDEVNDPSKNLENEPEVPGSQAWMRRQPKSNRDDVRNRYNLAVEYSDQKFGDLLTVLKEEGIYEETSIIVTADHGEGLGGHGRLEQAPEAIQTVLKRVLGERRARYYGLFDTPAFVGHQGIPPYEEFVHVPLLLKPAFNVIESDSYDELVELVDIRQTVRECIGLKTDEEDQGVSLFSQLVNQDLTKEYVFANYHLHNGHIEYRSVRSDNGALCSRVYHRPQLREVPTTAGIQSLLACLEPRHMTLDAADSTLEKRLKHELEVHINDCKTYQQVKPDRVVIDEETENQLSDLGYR